MTGDRSSGAVTAGEPVMPVVDELFATGSPRSTSALRSATTSVLDALERWWTTSDGPWVPVAPEDLRAALAQLEVCPEEGIPLDQTLDEAATSILRHGVRVTDPRCAAHLHCPTLVPAAAAELAIAATNQSMDSFDQAPAATMVEDRLVRWFADLLGLPPSASGVFTSGGTASNLLGLTLARSAAAARCGHDVWRDGLPPDADRWRIVCSAAAHFSIARSAALLGLGQRAVATVAVDADGALDIDDLDRVLAGLDADGLDPIALVGTAGTTDLGAVDPLGAIARRAEARGRWFHVDAAVGAALLLSPAHASRLRGIDRADSVTADLHKLFWQPIGTSVLSVRDERSFASIRTRSDYLDREDDEALDVLNLVGRSLDTSRRFDALKVWVSLRTVGRARLGAMVERVLAAAASAAARVREHEELVLVAPARTVSVVFRWRSPSSDDERADQHADQHADQVNTEVQRRLFDTGRAVVGRTRVDGRVHLKLTFVNPGTTDADARALVDLIAAEAADVAAALPHGGADIARAGRR